MLRCGWVVWPWGGVPSAQPQHTNYWAPRTRKRHQQEHRPQRPTECSDPTQHAEGRPGDCPGPRKGTTTQRNVTLGVPARSPPPPPLCTLGPRHLPEGADEIPPKNLPTYTGLHEVPRGCAMHFPEDKGLQKRVGVGHVALTPLRCFVWALRNPLAGFESAPPPPGPGFHSGNK